MGLGNTFDKIAENLVNQRKQYEEKCAREKIEKPFIVYQNSIGDERFGSLEKARKYLKEIIPQEFSVSKGEEEKEVVYDIEVSVKLIKKG